MASIVFADSQHGHSRQLGLLLTKALVVLREKSSPAMGSRIVEVARGSTPSFFEGPPETPFGRSQDQLLRGRSEGSSPGRGANTGKGVANTLCGECTSRRRAPEGVKLQSLAGSRPRRSYEVGRAGHWNECPGDTCCRPHSGPHPLNRNVVDASHGIPAMKT